MRIGTAASYLRGRTQNDEVCFSRRPVPGRSQGRKTAPGHRRDQCLCRAAGRTDRVSRRSTSRAAAWPQVRWACRISGISTMDDVLTDVRRITDITDLPVLVDIDTGWGGAFNIGRTIKSMIKFGAGAVHIEDQVQAKRCGHRPGKAIVSRRGDGRPDQGGRGRQDRSRLRDHGQDRCPCRGRARSGDRPGTGLRRGRGGHDLPGGHDRPRHVQEIRRRRSRCRSSPTSPSSVQPRSLPWRNCGMPTFRSCSIPCPRSAP